MLYHILLLTKYYLAKLGVNTEKGQGLAEYAIILLLVALVVIGSLITLGDQLAAFFDNVVDAFP